jgi:hypothetical protein
MNSMRSKLLALVLVMAIAGLVLASAEERAALSRGTAPSSTLTLLGAVQSACQRRRVLRRGDKRANSLSWRWRRDPPSGPSSRGHAVVNVVPDEDEKKQTPAENIDPSVPWPKQVLRMYDMHEYVRSIINLPRSILGYMWSMHVLCVRNTPPIMWGTLSTSVYSSWLLPNVFISICSIRLLQCGNDVQSDELHFVYVCAQLSRKLPKKQPQFTTL